MKRQDITQQRAAIATLEAHNVNGRKADNILRELWRQAAEDSILSEALERVDLDKAAAEVAAEHTGKREASKEAAYKELQTELELAKHSHREVCKRYDELHAVMQQFGITSADQLRKRLAKSRIFLFRAIISLWKRRFISSYFFAPKETPSVRVEREPSRCRANSAVKVIKQCRVSTYRAGLKGLQLDEFYN